MIRLSTRRNGPHRTAIILAVMAMVSVGLVSPAAADGGARYVRPGQSIQAAINAARSGDRIIVAPGTYAEQLTIDKDRVTLVGLGAILVSPQAVVPNLCSGLAGPGTEAGICVQGSGVVLADFVIEHRKVLSVDRPVRNVSVAGFQIRGFSGANIAVVGARNTRVIGNRLTDGQQYGVLTAGSYSTTITANTVSASTELQFIGMCMDDVGGTQFTGNHIAGYSIAMCVQTPGARVRNNDVSKSCIGAFIDPGVDGSVIVGNHIGTTNPDCRTPDTPFGSFGVIIDGAVNTQVRNNVIEGQSAGGLPSGFAAGVLVTDEGTAIASGNVITRNVLRHNDLDLVLSSAGTGNELIGNSCTTSAPPGLCT